MVSVDLEERIVWGKVLGMVEHIMAVLMSCGD